MSEFHTSYYKFDSPNEEDNGCHEGAFLMPVPDTNKARWHHIEDLDNFFVRVYQYHQQHGFLYIILEQCFKLAQFVFVVVVSTLLAVCVDYNILFGDKLPPEFHSNNTTEKVGFTDIFRSDCPERIGNHTWLSFLLIIALVVWLLKAIKIVFNLIQLLDIRRFYRMALHVKENELDNLTWHEIQRRLMSVQEEQQMCIHKQQLTELDIYNRILRFKNYMVAMVNKGLLPPRMNFPLLGDIVFFTQSLKYNMELIFFWGPRAIFANSYHMKDEYKLKGRREDLARQLSNNLLWLGIINLILSPAIFLWQVLYSFFSYAELLKRDPGRFGARKWSTYAKLYLRHFNELPHEFEARLNRAYKPASSYMKAFYSPTISLVARNVGFFAGSILALLVFLSLLDEDSLRIAHFISVMGVCGVIVAVCASLTPDEHAVLRPEQLMCTVVAQVHYAPDFWRGQAHTYQVRDEFSHLFQYKAVYILEELFSPIFTPFILIFWMRKRSLAIVDFFRNFTIDIAGVGDVCSFAQLDINKHGDPRWHNTDIDEPPHSYQADDGKTELSLMHFAATNPKWRAPEDEEKFLTNLKVNAKNDALNVSHYQSAPNPLLTSLNILGSGSMMGSTFLQPTYGNTLMSGISLKEQPHPQGSSIVTQTHQRAEVYRGATSSEGPVEGVKDGLVSSILLAQPGPSGPFSLNRSLPVNASPGAFVSSDDTRTVTSLEMSVSALYMHELHHQKLNERHNQMWETVAESRACDESNYSGMNNNQTAAVLRDSGNVPSHYGKGYQAIGELTSSDLFGCVSDDQSRAALKSSSQVSHAQPFLTVETTEFLSYGNEENSSDSDATPQDFHIPTHTVEAEQTSISVTIPKLPSPHYRPPEV
ncbi:autophagy-related protein 9A-like [Clavelina lepadiformis]|uniref:Autophagy-related protein 9 n=1 Tax=Clavelina lepadiformis TaxID=159417 RepID=A0ABP0GW47_CLALP